MTAEIIDATNVFLALRNKQKYYAELHEAKSSIARSLLQVFTHDRLNEVEPDTMVLLYSGDLGERKFSIADGVAAEASNLFRHVISARPWASIYLPDSNTLPSNRPHTFNLVEYFMTEVGREMEVLSKTPEFQVPEDDNAYSAIFVDAYGLCDGDIPEDTDVILCIFISPNTQKTGLTAGIRLPAIHLS